MTAQERSANRHLYRGTKYSKSKSAYERGKTAFKSNQVEFERGFRVNPYDYDSEPEDNKEWDRGYNDAYREQLTPEQLKYQ